MGHSNNWVFQFLAQILSRTQVSRNGMLTKAILPVYRIVRYWEVAKRVVSSPKCVCGWKIDLVNKCMSNKVNRNFGETWVLCDCIVNNMFLFQSFFRFQPESISTFCLRHSKIIFPCLSFIEFISFSVINQSFCRRLNNIPSFRYSKKFCISLPVSSISL